MNMTCELNIGLRRELFVDHVLIDRLDNTHLKLHEPVSGGVVIKNDKPWEGPGNFGCSVIEVDGRLLMYYRGWALTDAADQNGVGCVAESRDGGVTWTKPVLNLVSKPEWPDNNIIATDDGEPCFAFPCAPWVDTRPGVPVSERIKMIQSEPISGEKHTAMIDPAGPKRLVFWASADGFTFRKLNPQPEMVSNLLNCFDGGNTMFWSEVEHQYVLYYRWYDDEWGRGRRSMARTTSKDLMTWTPSVPMTYGDTPREQFYTNNTQPYFRAPHLYIAPSARFMEGRRAVTVEQGRQAGLAQAIGAMRWDWTADCSDGVLLTSRAGSTVYDRTFMETFIRPGLGYGHWTSRTNYPLTGILPAGPNQVQMFVSRRYLQDAWHIERLLLRTDGFTSVTAPWAGGEMVTKPFTFTGTELELNYRTGAPGFVRVEIQDVAGIPLSGFSLDDCPEIIGDEIKRVVAWKHGTDVSRLAGQPVRLRFVMKDADLFALRFKRENHERTRMNMNTVFAQMQTFALQISTPVVVAQAPVELDRAAAAWGRWQFPYLRRLRDGRLHASFSVEPDAASSYGAPVGHAYSDDEGWSWRVAPPQVAHEAEDGLLLSNGDRLQPVQRPARRGEEFDLPRSVCNYVESFGLPISLYRVEDLPAELSEWRFRRLPAGGSAWTEEVATMRIPNQLRVVIQEDACGATPGIGGIGQVRQGPLPTPFLWGKMRVAPDGSLWAVTYDLRLHAGKPQYTPLFLRSLDQGHTWDLLGEIPYTGDPAADPQADKRGGFTEPDYNFRPDGSVICLMRTSDGKGHGPLYLTRSVDGARTWSKPVAFDRAFDGGKMPQLLTLDNGVTLASYGQSGGPGYIAVRATTDPAGLDWQAPVQARFSPPAPGGWNSCGHTEMVALDRDRALLVYSDFNYRDAQGWPRKTILVREIVTEIER